MIPLVGFLPPSDPRVVSTVEAIERDLMDHGFVLRYRTDDRGAVDGLTGREGAFLACSFWLVDCLHMIGRKEDARELFERLLALRNDLGLLSEEYDPLASRLVGNFPQAFSHVSLINSAFRLSGFDPLALVDEGTRTVADHTPPNLERIRKLRPSRRAKAVWSGPLTTPQWNGARRDRVEMDDGRHESTHRHPAAGSQGGGAVPGPRESDASVLVETLASTALGPARRRQGPHRGEPT